MTRISLVADQYTPMIDLITIRGALLLMEKSEQAEVVTQLILEKFIEETKLIEREIIRSLLSRKTNSFLCGNSGCALMRQSVENRFFSFADEDTFSSICPSCGKEMIKIDYKGNEK